MKITCIIVDDDPFAVKSLEILCSKVESLQLVGTYSSGLDAIHFLERDKVDLVFLDIEMPGLNGLQFLEQKTDLSHVIITSGKKEYAFEAFTYQVSDYLHKPIQFQRFKHSVDQLNEKISNQTEDQSEFIYVKDKNIYSKVEYQEINYIKTIGDYVRIYTSKKNFILYSTLKNIENRLPKNSFIKVHRSYIVNLKKIDGFDDTSLIIQDKIIPVSRAHKQLLLNKLNTL